MFTIRVENHVSGSSRTTLKPGLTRTHEEAPSDHQTDLTSLMQPPTPQPLSEPKLSKYWQPAGGWQKVLEAVAAASPMGSLTARRPSTTLSAPVSLSSSPPAAPSTLGCRGLGCQESLNPTSSNSLSDMSHDQEGGLTMKALTPISTGRRYLVSDSRLQCR